VKGTTNLVPISELAIPMTRGAVIGAVLLAGFILFFVVVAVHNLFNGVALISSILWLLLVGGVIADMYRKNGIRRFLIDFLGAYCRRQFVRAVPRPSGPAEIQFGYKLFGWWFVYFAVSVDKIESVAWHAGQATSFAGRDMNDWSVGLWYDHGEPLKSQRMQQWPHADQDLYGVGPSGEKELTAAFGKSIVSFLRQAGAVLQQGKDENTFVRPRADVQKMAAQCPQNPNAIP
jgi:hypothetical protein